MSIRKRVDSIIEVLIQLSFGLVFVGACVACVKFFTYAVFFWWPK